MRLAGGQTINREEMAKGNWKQKYKRFCGKILKRELKIFQNFYTDSEGIFKAVPQDKFRAKKSLGELIINSDGFRGNEFEFIETPRTRVLLLGDSFTWGARARPINNSFAGLLQAAGYHIYNSGIIGTGPMQYARIAQKYIPLLKPDIVAVCLYQGNDIGAYPHPMEPNGNLYYSTEIGMFRGYDEKGNFFKNGLEVIEYLKKRKCGQCGSAWDYFLYKTAVGKAVHTILNANKPDFRDNYRNKKWVTDALTKIQKVCIENGSRFLLFIIPVAKRSERRWNSLERNSHLFKDFQYHCPGNFEDADYCDPPNDHFNNRGHKKFADFMIEVIRESVGTTL